MSDKTFRHRIKEWRESHGWIQKQAAEFFGITLSCYRTWEYGTRTPQKLAMIEVERRMKNASSDTQ